MALGISLAGDAVHGAAVAGLLRGADVASRDPSGGGGDERRLGRLDARARAGGGYSIHISRSGARWQEAFSVRRRPGSRNLDRSRRFGTAGRSRDRYRTLGGG